MTSKDKNESVCDEVISVRKRPARTCARAVIIDSDSENSGSDDVSKKTTNKKRKKTAKDSDVSFCIDEETKSPPKAKKRIKKENNGEGKKLPKTTKVPKKTLPKGGQKRVKEEKSNNAVDSTNVKSEYGEEPFSIPAKKIKTETIKIKEEGSGDYSVTHIGETSKEIKKEVYYEETQKYSNYIKEEADYKHNPSESKDILNTGYAPSSSLVSTNAREGDWVCCNTSCCGSNFAWRQQCYRCGADKPKWYNETKYKPESKQPLLPNPVSKTDQTKHIGEKSKEIKKEVYYEETQKYSNCIKEEAHYKHNPSESKDILSTGYAPSSSLVSTNAREGDWVCCNTSCGGNNFAWRQQCYRCGADKPKCYNETKYKPESTQPLLPNPVSKTDQTKQFKKEDLNIVESGNVKCEHTEDPLSKECSLVAKRSNLPYKIVLNVIKLFNSDATVPFIVRYRSHLTGGLSAEEIRRLKHHHESVKKVIEKAKNMKKKLESLGYLDKALSIAIDSCLTQSELDYLNEPFKVLKSSKLVKVIDLGLSSPAEGILNGSSRINLEHYVKNDLDLNEIIDLVVYYVGEVMSKDSELLDKVRELKKYERIMLTSKQKTSTKKKVPEKAQKKNRPEDVYSNYYEFECPCNRIRPHQILAINRGEAEHCLQVSLTIPNTFQNKLCHFARCKWYFKGLRYELRDNIFKKALDFMYNKRVCPYIKRLIRSELTKEGEKASLEVFSSNLKYLLLTPPIRNVTVCAIDPGFTHGCKIAILNPQQVVLQTDVLYLNNPHHFGLKDCKFVRYLNDYNVDLLVVGNGKGCRDVEFQISQLMNSNCLNKSFKYIVASENGISVYSCSPEAKEEYPDLSPNIISAISLAKRALDPLCELVKVEPKHLGVGMYQHDINEKKLDSELDDVVSECVSIVGVDLNNAPLRILKRVAGLSESKAKTIIEARDKVGSFINRDELKKVKGIGPKTFQQCAGFIKIIPGTCIKTEENSKLSFNYFDQTIIHPEDYGSAKKILLMNHLQPEKIGTSEFVSKLRSFMSNENIPALAKKLDIPQETLQLILEALSHPLDYDIRSTFDKPLFRNKATSMSDLVLNSVVSGQVQNVTHFGAFVDLGIETSGLIHHSHMQGKNLHLGQIVKVKITEINVNRMRIGLQLVSIESNQVS